MVYHGGRCAPDGSCKHSVGGYWRIVSFYVSLGCRGVVCDGGLIVLGRGMAELHNFAGGPLIGEASVPAWSAMLAQL